MIQIQQELRLAQTLNFRFTVEHVKGHQDDDLSYNELSRPAQLNVRADEYAHGQDLQYDELCQNPVSLNLGNYIITRYYKTQLRSASRSPNLRKYLVSKFLWKFTTPDLV